MNKRFIIVSIILILLTVSVAYGINTYQNGEKNIKLADTSLESRKTNSFEMIASDENVEEFLRIQNGEYKSCYENDKCYNITPDIVKENSDYQIFKYDQSCESFLLYNGQVYHIGIGFGGYGITSIALADLNKDDCYELYYTFSCGSGIHQSSVAYFNPITKKEVQFDNLIYDEDLIINYNGGSELLLSTADVNYTSFVEIKTFSKIEVGKILCEKGIVKYQVLE